VTKEGFVTDSYEQKFSLPEDVDTARLSSGISRDGVLMIRVPVTKSPDRLIPIQVRTNTTITNVAYVHSHSRFRNGSVHE
jgi:HSP20 family molecular chaperone IbpA